MCFLPVPELDQLSAQTLQSSTKSCLQCIHEAGHWLEKCVGEACRASGSPLDPLKDLQIWHPQWLKARLPKGVQNLVSRIPVSLMHAKSLGCCSPSLFLPTSHATALSILKQVGLFGSIPHCPGSWALTPLSHFSPWEKSQAKSISLGMNWATMGRGDTSKVKLFFYLCHTSILRISGFLEFHKESLKNTVTGGKMVENVYFTSLMISHSVYTLFFWYALVLCACFPLPSNCNDHF